MQPTATVQPTIVVQPVSSDSASVVHDNKSTRASSATLSPRNSWADQVEREKQGRDIAMEKINNTDGGTLVPKTT